MTKLLENVFSRVKKLPKEKQDSIAQIILEELEDEALWDKQFASSQDKLSIIAQNVKADISTGRTSKAGWDEL